MKIRPLHDRLVVKRVAEDSKTAGGLFIPDTAKEKPARGVVIAVGEGKRDEGGKRIALDVKAGDEVLFGKYAGTELKLDGEEHIVLREDEILAVIVK
jgi:chaperonin GroES